ncbi:MAG: hypothetical protein OEV79_04840 [candidate division WOR-3 bacterium]|nr:hypothetical protein [candidate division WOR-3 bacterium]
MCGSPGHAKKTIIAVVAFGMLLSYAIFLILPADTVIQSTREDGIIENFTAGFYLFASVFAFVLFFGTRRGNDLGFIKMKRNVFFLFLGIILFLIFGEEISWGQRIFGLATPGFLEEINVQREIGFHNLRIFRGMLRANRLLQYFCFLYAVLLPVIHLTIPRLKKWIYKINIPVVPVSMSLLFLFSYILSRIFNARVSIKLTHSVIEVMEFNFGILFLGATVWFLCSLGTKPQHAA